jgi:acyl carrier protein
MIIPAMQSRGFPRIKPRPPVAHEECRDRWSREETMSDNPTTGGPQFRADRPLEQETVRTTIVGGRPPGSGQPVGNIPRGIEVLIKKAAVDAAFKERLLSSRAAAAGEIGLRLEPAEALMLTIAPAAQLEAVIAGTAVPQEHRRAFLGQAAAAMLAALGLSGGTASAEEPKATKGVRPDTPWGVATEGGTRPGRDPAEPAPPPSAMAGVRAPGPEELKTDTLKPDPLRQKVCNTIAKQLDVDKKRVTPEKSLAKDLGADEKALDKLRIALQKQFDIKLLPEKLKKVETVGQMVDAVRQAVEKQPPAKPPSPALMRGVRADVPMVGGGVRPE